MFCLFQTNPNLSVNSILVQDSVKNQSLGAASAFAIRYYLSSNTSYDAADRLLCSRNIASLAAGASNPAISTSTILTICSIPTSLKGSYYVLAVVDTANVVVETNETNNNRSTLTPLLIGPDLLPLSIGVSKSGSTLTLTYALKNQGTQAAGSFFISYYLSSDSLYQSTDRLLCSRSLIGLGAGISSPAVGVATTACTIPSVLAAGAYRVLMRLDSGLTVLETNEGNNVKATAVTVSVP